MPAPLLPSTDFSSVTVFTGDMAYALSQPTFDGLTQYLGHLPKLTDASLDPSGVLSRVSAVTTPFLVTQVGTTGSVVTWSSGLVRTSQSGLPTVAAGQVNLPVDSTSYIFMTQDVAGVVTVQYVSAATDALAFAKLPVLKFILAVVTTVGANITQIVDTRSIAIRGLQVPQAALRVYGGLSQTDWTATQGQTISGDINCRNALIPAGVTITLDKYAKFTCSGSFTNNGTINQIRPGNGYPLNGTSFVKLQSIDAKSCYGSGVGSTGLAYDPALSLAGSGGGGGGAYILTDDAGVSYCAVQRSGGSSGATLLVESFGTITQNGTIDLSGAAGTVPTPFGGAPFFGAYSGSGGGSGGYMGLGSVTSIIFSSTGTTNIKGGNGSNAVWVQGASTSQSNTPGGFAGSGGVVNLTSPSINTTGHTFLLTGGVCGVPAGATGTLVTLGTGVYQRATAYGQLNTSGVGGGFGGVSGRVITVPSGANDILTYYNGGDGIVNNKYYSPVF